MTITEISSGSLFIVGLLLFGLGALVKRTLGHTEKRALMRREQEFTDAMEEWATRNAGPRLTEPVHAPHRENSRSTRAGAA